MVCRLCLCGMFINYEFREGPTTIIGLVLHLPRRKEDSVNDSYASSMHKVRQ